MLLVEDADLALGTSYAVQYDSLSLFINTLKRANDIVNIENVTAQYLNASNAVLKTVMPAVTAVNDKASTVPQIDRKARASKYIN